MGTIYLDNAATTPLRDEVREVMAGYQGDDWGNPSSLHRRGVAARETLDRARAQVARAVGAEPRRVIFTSSGTEANNLALRGLGGVLRQSENSIWIGPTEHASIRACAEALEQEGCEVLHGELNADGNLDLDQIQACLTPKVTLASQMLVSNEFGSIYPIDCVASMVRYCVPNALVHVDAIQALGKIPFTIGELRADSLSLSAHKIGGPQGVGALVLARELPLRPLIFGGGQESGLRSGTENVAGIAGFGVAAELAHKEQKQNLASLRERRAQLLAGLEGIEGLRCLAFGEDDHQQPGILSLLVPGAPAEVWLHHLDARGLVASVGSACQANKKEISPVLLAAGLTEEQARRTLRISLSPTNTPEDIDRASALLDEVAKELACL